MFEAAETVPKAVVDRHHVLKVERRELQVVFVARPSDLRPSRGGNYH
jgi:hypothetical protein